MNLWLINVITFNNRFVSLLILYIVRKMKECYHDKQLDGVCYCDGRPDVAYTRLISGNLLDID